MTPNLKIYQILKKLVLPFALLIIILSLLLSFEKKVLYTLFKIISPLYFLVAFYFILQFLSIKRISNKLEINKQSDFFEIDFDGKNASLHQQLKKPYRKVHLIDFIKCLFGKYEQAPPIDETTKIKMNVQLELIEKFLVENPNVYLETYTHNKIKKLLETKFDLIQIKTGKINFINWTVVSVHARGVVLQKPNSYAKYQIKIKA